METTTPRAPHYSVHMSEELCTRRTCDEDLVSVVSGPLAVKVERGLSGSLVEGGNAKRENIKQGGQLDLAHLSPTPLKLRSLSYRLSLVPDKRQQG